MNKIAVSTLVWKRPEVFEMFCKNFTTLDNPPIILICGSPDDECEAIAKKYSCIYVQHTNREISEKANVSARLARELEVDYVILTGSDDLMCNEMWKYYLNFKGDVLGLQDLYFHDLRSDRTLHWKGYNKNSRRYLEPIGAHKMISMELMRQINFEPYNGREKYPNEKVTHEKLVKLGVDMDIVTMEETGGIAVDVKNKASITQFRQWDNSKYVLFNESIGKSKYLSDIIKRRV